MEPNQKQSTNGLIISAIEAHNMLLVNAFNKPEDAGYLDVQNLMDNVKTYPPLAVILAEKEDTTVESTWATTGSYLDLLGRATCSYMIASTCTTIDNGAVDASVDAKAIMTLIEIKGLISDYIPMCYNEVLPSRLEALLTDESPEGVRLANIMAFEFLVHHYPYPARI